MSRVEKIGILSIVVIVAAFGIYFYTTIQADSRELMEAKEKKVSTILEKVTNPTSKVPVKYITLEEAYTLYVSGDALFLDARPEQDYGYMHIAGAMSCPYTIAKQLKPILELDRNRLIVVYCSSNSCPMAEVLATRLDELLFRRVYIFSGGLKEWYNAKYPLERGLEVPLPKT